MNTVLYIVGKAENKIALGNFFENLEIMNEQDLREFFKAEMDAGNIHKENLENHDITTQDDIFCVDISEIFGALCDNVDYDLNHVYYIAQQEVEINSDDMYD